MLRNFTVFLFAGILCTTMMTEALTNDLRIKPVPVVINVQSEETLSRGSLPIVEDENVAETEYLGKFDISYYCSCEKCCGKSDGITFTGAHVEDGVTISVDPEYIPLGSQVHIDEIGFRTAQDTGKAIKGHRIDVYTSDHEMALTLGIVKSVDVYLIK